MNRKGPIVLALYRYIVISLFDRAIKRIFCLALYAFEIADGFVYGFHKRKSIGVLPYDVFEIENLVFAHHADDYVAFGVAVDARADQFCCAVL